MAVVSALSVFVLKKKPDTLLHARLGIFFASVLLALPLSFPLWQETVLTTLFQFPYRFLALSVVFGAWFIAWMLDHLPRLYTWIAIVCIAALTIYPVRQYVFGVPYVTRDEGYYTTNEATTTVHDEYMPRWVHDPPTKRDYDEVIIYEGNGEIEVNSVTTQAFDLTVIADEQSTLQVQAIYYPGWGITVDGVPVEIMYTNEQGLMRFDVPPGIHAVYGAFRETYGRFVADLVTAVSGMLLLLYWSYIRKQKAKGVS